MCIYIYIYIYNRKEKATTELNLLPNPAGNAQNTYSLDWTIRLKLPFDSAFNCLITKSSHLPLSVKKKKSLATNKGTSQISDTNYNYIGKNGYNIINK